MIPLRYHLRVLCISDLGKDFAVVHLRAGKVRRRRWLLFALIRRGLKLETKRGLLSGLEDRVGLKRTREGKVVRRVECPIRGYV